MTTVAVMGSTGSIGTQTLDVVGAEAGDYEILALGASSSVDLLAEQAKAVRPVVVAIADETRAPRCWPAPTPWPTPVATPTWS
jgi:1-deoxy-D-xylulose-5-phosphate reductoisomerase